MNESVRNIGEYVYDAVAVQPTAVKAAYSAYRSTYKAEMDRRALERAARRIIDSKIEEMRKTAEAEVGAKLQAVAAAA